MLVFLNATIQSLRGSHSANQSLLLAMQLLISVYHEAMCVNESLFKISGVGLPVTFMIENAKL